MQHETTKGADVFELENCSMKKHVLGFYMS